MDYVFDRSNSKPKNDHEGLPFSPWRKMAEGQVGSDEDFSDEDLMHMLFPKEDPKSGK